MIPLRKTDYILFMYMLRYIFNSCTHVLKDEFTDMTGTTF